MDSILPVWFHAKIHFCQTGPGLMLQAGRNRGAVHGSMQTLNVIGYRPDLVVTHHVGNGLHDHVDALA